jgi:tetratricopeptide (TPR) repeat protein
MTMHDPGPDHDPERSQRRPLSLGRFDESGANVIARRLRSWDWQWIIAIALCFAVLLFGLRQPLAEWLWPQTRAERLSMQAERALAQGRLTAADGSGARELYAAALALDPDRANARAGLDRVGQAALAQVRAAVARRQFARAHEALQLADELSVPRAQADALREQLRRAEAGSVGIDALLRMAASAHAAGKLEGSDGALPLYQRVLELEPDRIGALEGREDVLSDLLQQAHAQLAAGDAAGAAAVVRRVQAADAGHVELPDLLAALTRAAEDKRKQADRHLASKELDQALEAYEAALQVNPDDADALHGVHAVASAHAQRSDRFAADYRFSEAEAELAQARTIAGTSAAQVPAIAEAQQHLVRARQSQRQVAVPAPTASQRRRVAQLLADAANAQARGDLITPPGDSAFDKLRAASAIAPQDPGVKAASARLAPVALQCFNEALRGNRLVRAGACLDARRALEGETGAVRAGRRELAQRWIALGDQRLSAGEIAGAQAALQSARSLDTDAAGLAAFADRLRMAAGAADREDSY